MTSSKCQWQHRAINCKPISSTSLIRLLRRLMSYGSWSAPALVYCVGSDRFFLWTPLSVWPAVAGAQRPRCGILLGLQAGKSLEARAYRGKEVNLGKGLSAYLARGKRACKTRRKSLHGWISSVSLVDIASTLDLWTFVFRYTCPMLYDYVSFKRDAIISHV
ncbi:hypothetical protein PV04_00209 [Phialophora macrospora]|uniref:Uncharacterized protein n=1 Tax=Phialophora macrospora TaxID=1851006 RepID=A0A0D2FZT5_9EURO|nr:hypothetical protein PV04_00209 [Phialophora macrospora]